MDLQTSRRDTPSQLKLKDAIKAKKERNINNVKIRTKLKLS